MKTYSVKRKEETIFDLRTDLMIRYIGEYLGIPNEQLEKIYLHELRSAKYAGLATPCLNKKGEVTRLSIGINTLDVNIYEQIMTLCHEMIHAKQYLTGEVTRKFKGDFKGNTYKFVFVRGKLRKKSVYKSYFLGKGDPDIYSLNGPLEKEAYERELEVYKHLFAHVKETVDEYQEKKVA